MRAQRTIHVAKFRNLSVVELLASCEQNKPKFRVFVLNKKMNFFEYDYGIKKVEYFKFIKTWQIKCENWEPETIAENVSEL